MSNFLDTLNPMQREAVITTEGPVLILAGAGSGKTRVLTHRAAYLISERGVMPWNILAITFTNKAAGEMRERIDRLCEDDGGKVWVATFHSTCGRILRQHAELLGYSPNFTIYDTDDQKTLIKRVLKKLDLDTKMYSPKYCLSAFSSAKNSGVDPDLMYASSSSYHDRKVAEIFEEYQKELKGNDAMDFDDMLINCVKLFKEHPEVLATWQARFKYIMVDEYQDTNSVQFEFIGLLASAHNNICVVGDDDQSIYKFRGADIRNILDFEGTFAGTKVIKLEQNYRSTKSILSAANEVIKNNTERKSKTLWTDAKVGDKPDFREFNTGYDEAEGIVMDIKSNLTRFAYGDCAVLYRTNAQSRLIEEKCVLYNVPYKLVGGVNFYQRREIKDIIAYLKTIATGVDDVAVLRIINVPKRGIGATTISKVQDYAAANSINVYDALKCADEIDSLNAGTKAKIAGFVEVIESIRLKKPTLSVKQLVEAAAHDTGYIEELHAEKTVEAETRVENIGELINKAAEFPDEAGDETALAQFLEEVALIADVDTLDEDENRVVLMTLHGAKGLEFPRVYIAGMEEGVFPSCMALTTGDDSDIEEERRLCYVGITRAKEKLSLCAARERMVNGDYQRSRVSRFIEEIPDDMLGRDSNSPRAKKPVMIGGAGIPSGGARSADTTGIQREKIDAYLGERSTTNMLTSLPYVVGDRVKHIRFGEGKVLLIEEGKRDFEVTVDFDTVGRKKLFASFAKLEKK